MDIGPGETADPLCGGRLRILQKAEGYRFSVDSLLLAWFTRVRDRGRVLDLGSGSGILAAVLAFRFPTVEVTGIEIQEEMARMARRTAALNGLDDRVRILRGDAAEIRNLVPPESFDVAVFNPPYRKLLSGRMNENAERAVARHELRGSLGTFLQAARYALRGGGEAFLVYPAVRGVELFWRMRRETLEPKTVRFVHSRRDSAGAFVLVRAVRGGGEELMVLPPLFLYGDGHGYSAEAMEIFREISEPPGPSGT